MTNSQDVLVGEILGSHGLKGWVQVFSFTRPPEKILSYSPWQLVGSRGREEFLIAASRISGKKVLVSFEQCVSRNKADELKAQKVYIDKSQMPELEEGDFYWDELVDMEVKTTKGICLGNVSSLIETGANDVLVVRPAEGSLDDQERLIPYVDGEIIVKVDQFLKQITVDWGPNY